MTQNFLVKVWQIFTPHERRSAIIVILIMAVSAFATAAMVGSIFPFLTVLSDPSVIHENAFFAYIYNNAGFSSNFDFVVALGIASIAVILVSNLLLLFNTWSLTHFCQMRIHAISHRLLAHYLGQPYEFFLSRHSGDMSTNILAEAERVVTHFIYPAMLLLSSLLTVLAVVGILMIANPLVAGSTLAVFGSIYGSVLLLSRRFISRMGQQRAEANQLRYRIAGEALSGIKDIKLLGREAAYLDRFSVPSFVTARMQERVLVVGHAPRYVIQMVGFGGMIVLALTLVDPLSFGERDALSDLLPLLGVMAFAGQRLLPELQTLYFSLTNLTAGGAALNQVHGDLYDGSRVVLEGADAVPLRLTRDLQLDQVAYTYPAGTRPGLECLSLTIRAGEHIGVVGLSGAGKTTLADIVLGLLQPQQGELRVDGKKLCAANIRAWQRSVGYVPQDIFLADVSLAENIALGLQPQEIDKNRLEKAARTALLHGFVMSELPNGYATPIGERGVRLSGGQRQRIGIARALYHDADLILFDEATSALDNLTESEVMGAIAEMPGEKTVVIIAHRLSTVRNCDRILLLERGKARGFGTWEELLAKDDLFRSLVAGL